MESFLPHLGEIRRMSEHKLHQKHITHRTACNGNQLTGQSARVEPLIRLRQLSSAADFVCELRAVLRLRG